MFAPQNGYYLTASDNPEYSNYFSEYYDCSKCAEGKGIIIPSVTFVVTEQCNLACTYCYEQHKTNKKMTKEVAKQAVDFLFSEKMYPYFSSNLKGFILDFIGGEPLLSIDIIEYVTNYFFEKAYSVNKQWFQNTMVNITSNGVLYFEEKVQKYLKENEGKVCLNITIDGNKNLHDSCRIFHNGKGSYDVVSKAVLANNLRLEKTNTKVTIAHENIDYIYESFLHLWNDLHIHFIHSNVVFENVWKDGDDERLYNQLIKVADYLIDNDLYTQYFTSFFDESLGKKEEIWDKNYCGGNGAMLAIGTDGKLYPCIRFMQYSLNHQKEKCIGSIYTGINTDDTWLKDLKAVTLESQSDEECKQCEISSNCALCTGFNYDEFGTPNKRAKYICKMHHARVKANQYYWNKLYKKLGLSEAPLA